MPRSAARLAGLGNDDLHRDDRAGRAHAARSTSVRGSPTPTGPRRWSRRPWPRCASGHNQYAPLPGVPALREAVLDHQRARYGLEPEEVLITFGATEAIAAALLGLCDPGTRSS